MSGPQNGFDMRFSPAMTILYLFWVNVTQNRGFHGLKRI
jgi:hypothetical protein